MREYKESPCYGCIEKSCYGCACSVCKTLIGYPDVWWSSKMMKTVRQNEADCDKFVERLWCESEDIAWVENSKGEMVLDQNWRGFPVGVFSQDDWFHWVDTYHSKGVGYVYENVEV